MIYNTQTDKKWADYVYDKTLKEKYTIGKTGCLITSLANIFAQTPQEFAEVTKKCYNNGYMDQDKVEIIMEYKRKKVSLSEVKQDRDYIIYFFWTDKQYRHFSNLLKKTAHGVKVFNVYNGNHDNVNAEDIICILEVTQ